MAGVRLPGLLACLATATGQLGGGLSQMQAQPNQFVNTGDWLWEAGDVAVFALQAGGAWAVEELSHSIGVAAASPNAGLVVLREAGLPASTSFYVTDNGVQRQMYNDGGVDSCAAYFANNGEQFYENHYKYTATRDLPFGTLITLQDDEWEESPENRLNANQLGGVDDHEAQQDVLLLREADVLRRVAPRG